MQYRHFLILFFISHEQQLKYQSVSHIGADPWFTSSTTPILTFTSRSSGWTEMKVPPARNQTHTIRSYIFFSKPDRCLAVVARRALWGHQRSHTLTPSQRQRNVLLLSWIPPFSAVIKAEFMQNEHPVIVCVAHIQRSDLAALKAH